MLQETDAILTSPPPREAASILRRARLRRGESLGEASRNTRIAQRHLESLERGAPPEDFPSPVYARLFLRTYARYLGLESESLMAGFPTTGNGHAGGTIVTEAPGNGGGPRRIKISSQSEPVPPIPVTPLRTGVGLEGRDGRGRAARRRPWLVHPNRPASRAEVAARRRAGAALLAIGVAAVLVIPAAWAVRLGHPGQTVADPPGKGNQATPNPNPPAVLPGGGRTIFPGHRVVAYYGAPISAQLGILGEGSPSSMAARLGLQAAAFDSPRRPVLPAMELIATVASRAPGDDVSYRFRLSPDVVDRYLQAARKSGALLIIDVQPGRERFLPEVEIYERWLKEPDVSLALDPEWRVGPDELPGQHLGSVDAEEINQVADYLARIVKENNLPQKLLVIHQFTESMITSRSAVKNPQGLAVVFDIDGVGGRAIKIQKYKYLSRGTERFHTGIKLFYRHDVDLMTPNIVVKLRPKPDLVIYQ
jgi:helix-turn-helix protein